MLRGRKCWSRRRNTPGRVMRWPHSAAGCRGRRWRRTMSSRDRRARSACWTSSTGRRQLIVYRAFLDPGVHGWPEHGCVGCSLMADHIGNLAHLNARDTTLVYASRGSQADIARIKARMGWDHPWYTIVPGPEGAFDVDFGVDEWHGTNAFIRDGDRDFPHVLHRRSRRRGVRQHVELPRHDRAWAPGDVGGLPGGLPADQALPMVALARRLRQPRVLAEGVTRVFAADPRQVARIYQDTKERITTLVAASRRCRD